MMWRRASRISDEELDWAIRAALRAETEGLEPSPEVWQRVRAHIENPHREQTRPSRASVWHNRLATLAQAAVLAALVLGFGVGINRTFPYTGWAQPTLTPKSAQMYLRASGRYPNDILTARRLMALEQQKPVPGAWRWPQ